MNTVEREHIVSARVAPLVTVNTEVRRAAQRAVRRAVRRGVLTRREMCEHCGRSPNYTLHGHHYNGYDEAHILDVEWLCRSCHSKIHSGRLGGLATARNHTVAERSAMGKHASDVAKQKISKETRVRVASMGGRAAVAKLTPGQHTLQTRRAAQIRWAKHREQQSDRSSER